MAKKESTGGWESERVIALIGGGSGDGKSFFVANAKDALIYDTDIGGGLAYADARIQRNGSERIAAQSYLEVLEDLTKRAKAGTLKNIRTVAIDHVTALQQESNIRHNPAGGSDYGRANELATREWRKIRNFARNQDFNLICTAHLKGKYENDKVVGMIADGSKNMEADFGIVVYLQRRATHPSMGMVMKWRRDPEDARGPVPSTFTFTMDKFEEIAGSVMGRERKAAVLASEDQVKRINELLAVVKLEDGLVDRWFKRLGIESFAEMTTEQIEACIKHVQDKVAAPKAA